MPSTYFTRSLEPALKRAAIDFPALVLTGPRQSGKTTLLKRLFGKTHAYASLDDPVARSRARTDPVGFLDGLPEPFILDEFQYAPELLSYLKIRIDARRGKRGRFLLTGSQQFALMKGVTESLAGRAAILKLHPLTLAEMSRDPGRAFPWERKDPSQGRPSLGGDQLWESLIRGSYPELAARPSMRAKEWKSSYLMSYLERDVRDLRQIGDLSQFQSFMQSLAARSGQLLNLADISRDLGISLGSVKQWLSVLEASFQVVVLRPWYENTGIRLVKTPKVYFTDTGLLAQLSGLEDPRAARQGPMAGAFFESAVFNELHKRLDYQGGFSPLYFWRSSDGREVDFVVHRAGRLIPIECKATSTPNPGMLKGIRAFREAYGNKVDPGLLIHSGTMDGSLETGTRAMPLPFF